jgi:peptide/nickel transport system ATP-binding protein
MSEQEIMKVENLVKWFPVKRGFFSTVFSKTQMFVHAVDGVSLTIKKGQIFGLVGESGSGKTTTGRLMLRLIEPTDGTVRFKDTDVSTLPESELKPLRRKMQIIFQDPYESLNPRMTTEQIITEPLSVQGIGSREEEKEMVLKILEDVQLVPPEDFLPRYPHELSGGQRQRVAVARAFVLDPEFVVADEPVSMLDVSIRAEILDLMLTLVETYFASFLYITHDIALARHICNDIAVMYLGKVMEQADTDTIVYEPLHPYTRALISAVPVPDPTVQRSETVLKGEIPSPIRPPSGCRFHTRCPIAQFPLCREKEPPFTEYKEGHFAACHMIDTPIWKKHIPIDR